VTGSSEPLRWAALAWSAAVGAAVGSFLNVVIARVPAGESILHPRSRCPSCRTPIAWWDNVPVLSWIALRGRCRACRAPISWRYPMVELLGAAAALACVGRHGLSPAALAEFALASALLALSFIDLDTWLLPHAITIPLLVAGIALSALRITPAGALLPSLVGAAVGWGTFALVAWLGERILRKEALGFGDVWLLGAIGSWTGAWALLPVVLLASVQGTVVGLGLMIAGRGQPGPPETATPPAEPEWVPPRNAVPFGPFLAAGAMEWIWLQGWIVQMVPGLSIFR
jgi:leader peptidase (prepilin peptidase)/N-methyltransferase